ncbi:30S ribosomal protein S20 [Candidatus Amarobacter glycogenicus]|uniref:30S ribosomal protein S20 n=1 Tax=Candidatus Amarobacter glycogenicus TaxID=3140699 RepID=UPI002A0F298F|nr:30S ribosomal protein S20 [Dehalococcoidia bacterium]
MAHHKSAIKRWHQSLRERGATAHAAPLLAVPSAESAKAVAAGDETATREALSAAYSALDRAAKMGAIHTGKADRTKARLAAFISKGAA